MEKENLIEELNRYKAGAKYWGKIAFDPNNTLNNSTNTYYDSIDDLSIADYRRGEGEVITDAKLMPIHLYLLAKYKIRQIQRKLRKINNNLTQK